ncbi:hypothetical protein [Pararhizobium haloflavum]|uniref:hypothetical protein n=1 Tax=Pararhizobium haloflavum TaxID=2037914 RepID=UPI000C1749E2|nr:hypothetical protein [Pararhizobium haloflavum]
MLGFNAVSGQPIASVGGSFVELSAALTGTASLDASMAGTFALAAALDGESAISGIFGIINAFSIHLEGSATIVADYNLQAFFVSLVLTGSSIEAALTPIRGFSIEMEGDATVSPFMVSAFEALITDPTRRLTYAVELDPWPVQPYSDAA